MPGVSSPHLCGKPGHLICVGSLNWHVAAAACVGTSCQLLGDVLKCSTCCWVTGQPAGRASQLAGDARQVARCSVQCQNRQPNAHFTRPVNISLQPATINISQPSPRQHPHNVSLTKDQVGRQSTHHPAVHYNTLRSALLLALVVLLLDRLNNAAQQTFHIKHLLPAAGIAPGSHQAAHPQHQAGQRGGWGHPATAVGWALAGRAL